VEFLFNALNLDGKSRPMPCLKRAIESGQIEWLEHEGFRVVQRLRAAAMGLPFLPAPDVDVPAVAAMDPVVRVMDPFSGDSVPVERAFSPEVALIHAQAADDAGNLFIEDPTTDLLVAGAAQRVIATCEKRVASLDWVTLPSFQVAVIAHAPGGALPSGCAGHYPHDSHDLERYLTLAGAGRVDEYFEQRFLGQRRGAA
jgi:glutaconate CoA-transferase subunit A